MTKTQGQKHRLDHGSEQCTKIRQFSIQFSFFPLILFCSPYFPFLSFFVAPFANIRRPNFKVANLEEHFRALQCISMALCLHLQCLIRPSSRQQQLRTQCSAKRARLAGMAKVRAFVEQHFEHLWKI